MSDRQIASGQNAHDDMIMYCIFKIAQLEMSSAAFRFSLLVSNRPYCNHAKDRLLRFYSEHGWLGHYKHIGNRKYNKGDATFPIYKFHENYVLGNKPMASDMNDKQWRNVYLTFGGVDSICKRKWDKRCFELTISYDRAIHLLRHYCAHRMLSRNDTFLRQLRRFLRQLRRWRCELWKPGRIMCRKALDDAQNCLQIATST